MRETAKVVGDTPWRRRLAGDFSLRHIAQLRRLTRERQSPDWHLFRPPIRKLAFPDPASAECTAI